MATLTFSAVFIGGILSVLSPCMLPLVPTFLGYLSGISITSSYGRLEDKIVRWKLFLHALVFGVGFSLILLLVGGVVGWLGEKILQNNGELRIMGGIFIIVLGVTLTGIFKNKRFQKTYRLPIPQWIERFDYLKSFLVGIFFAIGWSPCYGPILGSILTLVALEGSQYMGVQFFMIYSLGFMIPFLGMSLFVHKLRNWLKKSAQTLQYVSVLSGILVITIGVLLLTNHLSDLYNWILPISHFSL